MEFIHAQGRHREDETVLLGMGSQESGIFSLKINGFVGWVPQFLQLLLGVWLRYLLLCLDASMLNFGLDEDRVSAVAGEGVVTIGVH